MLNNVLKIKLVQLLGMRVFKKKFKYVQKNVKIIYVINFLIPKKIIIFL